MTKMDHYPHTELDAMQANPTRRDVVLLVAEVKRLTAIALAAEQYFHGRSTTFHGTIKDTLRYTLGTMRSRRPLFPESGLPSKGRSQPQKPVLIIDN